MKVRAFESIDETVLRELHERGGYGFPFPDNIADYLIVTDDANCPIMAAGEKMVPEITMLCASGGMTHPLVKLEALSLLHEALRDRLVRKGFKQAFVFLAPGVEKAFGRHLQRHFRWKPTWKGYAIEDWRP